MTLQARDFVLGTVAYALEAVQLDELFKKNGWRSERALDNTLGRRIKTMHYTADCDSDYAIFGEAQYLVETYGITTQ